MMPSIRPRPPAGAAGRRAAARAARAARAAAPLLLAALGAACGPRRPAAARAAPAPGARVPPEAIAAYRGTRVEDLIQGRVAGVQVSATGNGDYAVRVRGVNTVLGSDAPLFVIDGVQVRAPGVLSALAGVDPRSVDRIEVLKDAGSTAIYGVLGGNGVIVVTTKRGRR